MMVKNMRLEGRITGKNFSSGSSGSGSRRYYLQIDDSIKIKVKRTEYYDFDKGDNIEVKISKNGRINLSILKVL